MTEQLQRVDYLLMAAGGILLAAAWVRWWRSGRRDPLRGSPLRPNRLTAIQVWLCILVNLLGWSIGGQLGLAIAPDHLAGDNLKMWQAFAASLLTNTATLLACLWVGRLAFTGGLEGLGIGRRSLSCDAALSVGAFLVAMMVTGSVIHLTDWVIQRFFPGFAPPDHSVFQILKDPQFGPATRALTVLGAFILAPVSEELLFRGILQTGIRRMLPPRPGSLAHRWVAILVVGVLFGAVHSGTPQHIPALAALGMLFGFVYERTGSLRACMLLHMLFNGRSLLWDFLVRQYGA